MAETRKGWGTFRSVLDVTATAAIIVAAGVVIYANWPRPRNPKAEPPLPSQPVAIETATIIGNRAAKIAVIEYSEFQCPFCARFSRDTEPTLKKRYVETGQVLIAFRHLPLEAIHPFARSAAEGAECAAQQDRFGPMHDLLFSDQKGLSLDSPLRHAATLGLDLGRYRTCLDSSAGPKVSEDIRGAKELGISGTPTFLIGVVQPDGRVRVSARLTGAKPVGDFEIVLDKLIKEAGQ